MSADVQTLSPDDLLAGAAATFEVEVPADPADAEKAYRGKCVSA